MSSSITKILNQLTKDCIEQSLAFLESGGKHSFSDSTHFDVVYNGKRFPPKAVIGVAAELMNGTPLSPSDFKGGKVSTCFRILERHGFRIERKPSVAWILQGNPKVFPVDQYLQKEGFKYWSAPKFKDEIKLGDIVYIYKCGKNASVLAKGIVEEAPSPKSLLKKPKHFDSPLHNLETDRANSVKVGINVLETRVETPRRQISRDDMKNNVTLKTCSLITSKQSSVFKLTDEERKELEKLWDYRSQNEDIDREILTDEETKVVLGSLPDIPEGRCFKDRQELHDANVHRGIMGGIAPKASSVVLSGGYKDDRYDGDTIIYTGQGGRDPATGRQVANQTLTKGNKYLATNHLNGIPIRVIVNRKYDSDIPPGYEYKYVGLFKCSRYWQEKGIDGFIVYRFYLEKIRLDESIGSIVSQGFARGNSQPKRAEVRCSRVVRNSKVGEDVKNLYDYFCQICGCRLILPAGPYAECCHIKPLGRPAEGPDTIDNVLCLCPNCHVLLDEGAIWVNNDFTLGGKEGVLKVHPLHQINSEYIIYHRKNCGSD